MEMKFESRHLSCYRETFHQLKRIQESTESVVPDTDDDIGRIASVQSSVFLKSKDEGSREVTVTGEAVASLLYINENENRVSRIELVKPFTMVFESGDIPAGSKSAVNLSISNTEARALNPRKVSVTFEITGDIVLFSPENIEADVELPQDISPGVHFKFESTDAELPVSVCEKTFTVNEQYVFPSGKGEPVKLFFEHCDFNIEGRQFIGSKVILKGSIICDICYISNEVEYPLRTRFTSAFSQIIDSGIENIESCTEQICLTSAYFELTDTISGEKALDAELHALVQLVCRRRETIKYISDAYCNTMPSSCKLKSEILPSAAEIRKIGINLNEELSLPDDCSDVLCVFLSPGSVTNAQSAASLSIGADIIYKNSSGSFSSARRVLTAEDKFDCPGAKYLGSRIEDINIKAEGNNLSLKLKAELIFAYVSCEELCCVTGMELFEDAAYDMTKYPSLSLVRQEGESIWELASQYRSSPEAIEHLNSSEAREKSSLLLIPKEI